MNNLRPASLCDLSSEECAGFFVFRGPKPYLEAVCRKADLDAEQELMLAVLYSVELKSLQGAPD